MWHIKIMVLVDEKFNVHLFIKINNLKECHRLDFQGVLYGQFLLNSKKID